MCGVTLERVTADPWPRTVVERPEIRLFSITQLIAGNQFLESAGNNPEKQKLHCTNGVFACLYSTVHTSKYVSALTKAIPCSPVQVLQFGARHCYTEVSILHIKMATELMMSEQPRLSSRDFITQKTCSCHERSVLIILLKQYRPIVWGYWQVNSRRSVRFFFYWFSDPFSKNSLRNTDLRVHL